MTLKIINLIQRLDKLGVSKNETIGSYLVKSSHYRMLSLVGKGEFGKVYSAIHRQTGELVALKELNIERFSTKKFLREIRILLSLDHENIVRCLGIEHSKKNRFLVTEYCDGGTLRDFINAQIKLNIEQKLKIVIDILSGLSYVHLQGIIHRDLKPENILLTVSPTGWIAKISDFGVAKIENEDRQTDIYSLGDTGSPAYMAPEQFYGKYSYSSDIYAVGVILYELLMGKRPFGGSPKEIMVGHLNLMPYISEDFPVVLQDIIKTALAKLPQHRFRTAKEMKLKVLKCLLKLNTVISSDNPFFSDSVDYAPDNCSYDSIDVLDGYFNFLAVNNECIYLANDNHLLAKDYEIKNDNLIFNSTNNYSLDGTIKDLKSSDIGCTIVTKNKGATNSFSIGHFVHKFTSLYSFNADTCLSAIAPNCNWIALSIKNKLEKKFQLIKPEQITPSMLDVEDFVPQEIVIIDQGHGLVSFQQQEINPNYTFWRLFTRKGYWYNNYCLNLPLENIVVHSKYKNYFLTRETFTNYAVLVNLQPLKIKRIFLDFYPHFILSYDNYFICASTKGNISIIDTEANIIKNFNLKQNILNLKNINDNIILGMILLHDKYHLIALKNLITSKKSKSQKYA